LIKNGAVRFINAYNTIDHTLRTIYNFKRNISFSDVIRRSVGQSSLIRKYEDDLIDYSRLRNAIIHGGDDQYIIAEPHEDIVEEIEKIAKLISTPPLALQSLCKNSVYSVDFNSKIKKVITLISTTGYSNLPVYKDSSLLGVANANRIIKLLGQKLSNGVNAEEYLSNTNIEEVVSERDYETYYVVKDAQLTLEKALNLFDENRKLTAIIITKTGNRAEKAIGIITTADVLDMNKILENY
jgi:predicted transcriptional regulator